MVYVSEDTPYMKLLKPFLEKKKVSLKAKEEINDAHRE